MLNIVEIEVDRSGMPTSKYAVERLERHIEEGWTLLSVTTGQRQRTGDWFDLIHFYHFYKKPE